MGPFYTITTDVISKLLETLETYSDPVLDLNDIFVTGLLAEKAGVPRFNLNKFLPFSCEFPNYREMPKLIALGNCRSDQLIINIFDAWRKINGNNASEPTKPTESTQPTQPTESTESRLDFLN